MSQTLKADVLSCADETISALGGLKAKPRARNWSELVVDDKNIAEVISAAPGSKVARHLHSDAPEYWVVQEGRI
jgi:mannose-6-phosphate isomerase-like protein (cupin superfamily)